MMNAQQLWNLFLGGEVPDTELVALGEDAGMLEGRARAPSQQALLKICMHAAKNNGGSIVFTPSQLFDALKFAMPESKLIRRGLLHAVASQYEKKIPFGNVSVDVQGFFVALADALGPFTSAALPQVTPPAPAPSATIGAADKA